MDQIKVQEIKRLVEKFFEKTGFDVQAEFSGLENETIPVRIKAEEPRVLIGQNGQTLAEIQHLLRAITTHSVPGEHFYIDLDINDYKEKKLEYLKQTAKEMADEVAITKKERALSPMPAYERRAVHMELAGRTDVTTESAGQGPERKVIIKPYLS